MTLICLFMDICYQHLLTSWHHPALSVYRLLRVSQCDIESSMSSQTMCILFNMLVAVGTRLYQPACTRGRNHADGAFLQASISPQKDFVIY